MDLSAGIAEVGLSPLHYIQSDMSNSFFLYPVSGAEWSEIIAKMKISFTGRDVMPIKLLIHARHLSARPISALINESFTSGVFPDILKIAKITPIFKNGNPLDVSNYRPISVLHG